MPIGNCASTVPLTGCRRTRTYGASRPAGRISPVKTFEELFAELQAKAAAGTPGSGTVAALEKGVHFIGKKVVEEAAESWMAAEHEGAGADRRGDLPAALPGPGAHARQRSRPEGRLPTSVSAPTR